MPSSFLHRPRSLSSVFLFLFLPVFLSGSSSFSISFIGLPRGAKKCPVRRMSLAHVSACQTGRNGVQRERVPFLRLVAPFLDSAGWGHPFVRGPAHVPGACQRMSKLMKWCPA